MAFGSLVPGMAAMPIPQMKNTGIGQQGAQLLQMARGAQGQPGGQPGGGQQGLIARLTGGGAPGAPTDLAAPGMPPNAGPPGAAPGGNPMQMGLLAKLFGGMQGGLGGMMGGGGAAAPAMPAGGIGAAGTPNILGGLY